MTFDNADPSVEVSWALFFDFDGTLVDIADRPDAIVLPPDVPSNLHLLAQRLGGALAILTGRQIAEIDMFLSPYQLDVAGVHGAELRLSSAPASKPFRRREGFAALLAELRRRFEASGLLVEDKGLSVAVHWRLHPQFKQEVLGFMSRAAEALAPDYRLQLGKAVAEILPAGSSKASILAKILSSPRYAGRRPLFVGDDLTDEEGFGLVNRLGGVSVRIGSGPSLARHLLPEVAHLRQHLARWASGAPIEPDIDFQA
jgi:trehalose 6-phosphate phosphatase